MARSTFLHDQLTASMTEFLLWSHPVKRKLTWTGSTCKPVFVLQSRCSRAHRRSSPAAYFVHHCHRMGEREEGVERFQLVSGSSLRHRTRHRKRLSKFASVSSLSLTYFSFSVHRCCVHRQCVVFGIEELFLVSIHRHAAGVIDDVFLPITGAGSRHQDMDRVCLVQKPGLRKTKPSGFVRSRRRPKEHVTCVSHDKWAAETFSIVRYSIFYEGSSATSTFQQFIGNSSTATR